MRDFAACLSEYAVQVSDTSCSSAYSTTTTCIPLPSSSSSSSLIPSSILNSVTCLYKINHRNKKHKHLLISLSWANNSHSHGLTITFGDDPSTSTSLLKLNTNPRIFRKLKGTKTLEFQSTTSIEVYWDLSAARYEAGPEPIDGFYVFITLDSQLALIVGDMGDDTTLKFPAAATAKSSLISRQEHFSSSSGNALLYSTRARFCESGLAHDILIHCSGGGFKYPAVMSVSIDKKTVTRVKRLQWNFRGNQTIFLDGLLVDLMWDVHGWFFNSGPGYAVFMFRTRSGMDSRLWLEEKMVHKDEDDELEFSLMIYACKTL